MLGDLSSEVLSDPEEIMKRKSKITEISILIGLMLLLALSLSPASATPSFQEDPEKPQMAMVIDVSNSMDTIVLPSELPGDLKLIQDRIDEIEDMDQFTALNEKIKSINEDPYIVDAKDAADEADADVNNWLPANGFGNKGEIESLVGNSLSTLNCRAWLNNEIVNASTMTEVDELIADACEGVEISPESAQIIKNHVLYIEDPGYAALKSTADQRQLEYSDARNALGYEDTNRELQNFLSYISYDDTQREFDQIAEKLGFSTRLNHAKLAAQTILDITRFDNQARYRETLISLDEFSTTPKHLNSLTNNYDLLHNLIAEMEPIEFTNIGGGLTLALDEIEHNGDPDQPSSIILLSDGHANRGMSREEMLKVIPERAIDLDARICAIGFGNDESEVDKRLLEGLAEATNGAYLFATTGEELVGFFVACQQALVADVVKQFNGIVPAGQIIEGGRIQVLEDTISLNISMTYLKGSLQLILTDPVGTKVTDQYPGVQIQDADNLQLITLADPVIGEWTVQVQSTGSGTGSNIYNIAVSSEMRPIPTEAPILAVIPTSVPTLHKVLPPLVSGIGLTIILGGLALVIFLVIRKKKPPQKPTIVVSAALVILCAIAGALATITAPRLGQPVISLLEGTPTRTPQPTATITPTPEPTITLSPTPIPLQTNTPTPVPVVINASNVAELKNMRQPIDITVFDIAIALDGETLAAAAWDGWTTTMDKNRFQVKLLQLQPSGAAMPQYSMLGHLDTLRGVAFPANSADLLASASDDNFVKIWQVSDGTLLREVIAPRSVFSIVLSPDGAVAIGGLDSGEIKIWNTQDMTEVTTLNAGRGPITSLAMSPDGSQLASVQAVQNDFTIRLWDPATWRETRRLSAHLDIVSDMDFSPDSTLLATGAYDTTARLYEVASGRLLYELAGHTDHVNAVTFSPNGELLITGGSDKLLKVWQVSDGMLLLDFPVKEMITSLAFTPGGDLLIVGEMGQMAILGIQ
jgi:hypothetical protein